MSISITIKPGTWVARTITGAWVVYSREPDLAEKYGGWINGGNAVALNYVTNFFDLSSFPTFAEPDWRKTKFQVTQSLLKCESELMVKVQSDIVTFEDGMKYYCQSGGGGLSAWMLRAIADELDRQNADWKRQIAKEMTKFQVGE